MVYIDLNPFRAKIAETPENSEYTSIREQIAGTNIETNIKTAFHGKFMPFMDSKGVANEPHIPMHLIDYIELVDWFGRQIRPDKRGAISDTAPPILPSRWPKMAARYS